MSKDRAVEMKPKVAEPKAEPTAEPKAEPRGSSTCASCKFWKVFGAAPSVSGHCVRYPPLLIHNPNAAAVGDTGSWSFPSTAGNEWCGEWVARSETPPAGTQRAFDLGAFA
jgi:hypothetical protein